jgi:hypothetical protein
MIIKSLKDLEKEKKILLKEYEKSRNFIEEINQFFFDKINISSKYDVNIMINNKEITLHTPISRILVYFEKKIGIKINHHQEKNSSFQEFERHIEINNYLYELLNKLDENIYNELINLKKEKEQKREIMYKKYHNSIMKLDYKIDKLSEQSLSRVLFKNISEDQINNVLKDLLLTGNSYNCVSFNILYSKIYISENVLSVEKKSNRNLYKINGFKSSKRLLIQRLKNTIYQDNKRVEKFKDSVMYNKLSDNKLPLSVKTKDIVKILELGIKVNEF